jgi:hypothetical protein
MHARPLPAAGSEGIKKGSFFSNVGFIFLMELENFWAVPPTFKKIC